MDKMSERELQDMQELAQIAQAERERAAQVEQQSATVAKSRAHVRPTNGDGDTEKLYYTTASGYTIQIGTMSPMLGEKIKQAMIKGNEAMGIAAYPEPRVPTYTAQLVGGATRDFEHNETTIPAPRMEPIKPDTDDESLYEEWVDDHRAWLQEQALIREWAQYTSAVNQWNAEYNRRVMRAIMAYGIKGVTLPDDDEWADMQTELFGIEVPTKPRERLIHYIETVVLGSAHDMETITNQIMYGMGIDEETAEAAKAMFRRSLEKQQGENAS